MKNYSFFDTVGDGLQAIGAHVSNFFVQGYHRLRGSWYCPYCGKSHPRRRVKFALTITSQSIRIDELRQSQCTEKPCVCFLGYSALVADKCDECPNKELYEMMEADNAEGFFNALDKMLSNEEEGGNQHGRH